MTHSNFTFSCVLIKQAENFSALCVDLDVASEGATATKAKRMLQEAVEMYLESAFENNLPYLRPIPREEDPRYNDPKSIVETFPLKVNLAVQVHA